MKLLQSSSLIVALALLLLLCVDALFVLVRSTGAMTTTMTPGAVEVVFLTLAVVLDGGLLLGTA